MLFNMFLCKMHMELKTKPKYLVKIQLKLLSVIIHSEMSLIHTEKQHGEEETVISKATWKASLQFGNALKVKCPIVSTGITNTTLNKRGDNISMCFKYFAKGVTDALQKIDFFRTKFLILKFLSPLTEYYMKCSNLYWKLYSCICCTIAVDLDLAMKACLTMITNGVMMDNLHPATECPNILSPLLCLIMVKSG